MNKELTIGSPTKMARSLVDRGMDAENATALGWVLHDLDARANSLNIIDVDLAPVADEIDLIIAKLTKAAERIKK